MAKIVNGIEDVPTSDLLQSVCEDCSAETIIENAENYIPETEFREFLLACLGYDIK